MATIPFSTRCKVAAVAAGTVLALALLALSTASMLLSKRVKAESGERLIKQAEQVAARLAGGLTPTLAEQLRKETENSAGRQNIYVLSPSGRILLPPSADDNAARLDLPVKEGWQINRWPDGQVYLSGMAPIAGNRGSVRIREPLDVALAEVQQLQWDIFLRALPLAAVAALLGGALAGRGRRRVES
jgi:hypothetical protein